MRPAAVVREVPKTAQPIVALPAVAAAMEHRSLLGSVTFPHPYWGPIPSAEAAAAAPILLAALAALAAAGKAGKVQVQAV
jgi:hypothetical protein